MNTSLITTCTLAVASGFAMAEKPSLTTSGQILDRPIYVGDRGLDICGVEVYSGNASCDTITNSGVSCGTSTDTAVNSVARPLPGFPGGAVACVDLGFETVTGGAGAGMVIELYTDDDGIPNVGGMTLLGSVTADIPDGDNQIARVTFDTPVECPAGNLVVVANYADLNPGLVFHGGDVATDGIETYILADTCSIGEYTTMTDIGFAGSDWTVCLSLAGDFDPCDFPLGSCAEDTNGDLIVNVIDLLAVISDFGSTGDGSFRPAGDIAPAPNGDCTVNTIDLLASVSALGTDCTPRGACCLGDDIGTCEGPLSQDECDTLGGTYQGTDTDCAALSCPLPVDNDECATASVIEGDIATAPIDTTTATPSTPEPDETQCPDTYLEWGGSADVWYSWTPSYDGAATISTCDAAGFDTSLVVYEGSCDNQIACNGDDTSGDTGCQQYYSKVSINAVGGTTYYFRIGGWQGATGLGSVTVANIEQNPGACCLDVFTCLDNFEPAICADTGGTFQGSGLTCAEVNCDTTPRGACCLSADSCLDDQTVEECSSAGGAWLGDGTLCAISSCFDPVTNDECVNAVEMYDGANSYATLGATTSAEAYGETNADGSDCSGTFLGAMNADVWFTYTAVATGDVSLSTCDTSSFDTDLVVYEGSCTALVQIACNGDSGEGGCQQYSSGTSFSATAGTTYTIRIGGYDAAASGTGTLTIAGPGATGVCCTDGACSEGTQEDCVNGGGSFTAGGTCATTVCPTPLVCNGDAGEYGEFATAGTADAGANITRGSLIAANSVSAISVLAIEYNFDGTGFTGECATDEDMDFTVTIWGDSGGLPDPTNVLFEGVFDEDSVDTGNVFAATTIKEYSFDLGTTVATGGICWISVQGGAGVEPGSETAGCWFLIADVVGGATLGVIDDGTGFVADTLQLAICVTGEASADVCGDGFCTGDESYDTCPADCADPSVCAPGTVADCDGSGECIDETWIGDSYCDGDAQAYEANLCCYELDGGDCSETSCNGDPTDDTE
jgi:hypothetical protein